MFRDEVCDIPSPAPTTDPTPNPVESQPARIGPDREVHIVSPGLEEVESTTDNVNRLGYEVQGIMVVIMIVGTVLCITYCVLRRVAETEATAKFEDETLPPITWDVLHEVVGQYRCGNVMVVSSSESDETDSELGTDVSTDEYT